MSSKLSTKTCGRKGGGGRREKEEERGMERGWAKEGGRGKEMVDGRDSGKLLKVNIFMKMLRILEIKFFEVFNFVCGRYDRYSMHTLKYILNFYF